MRNGFLALTGISKLGLPGNNPTLTLPLVRGGNGKGSYYFQNAPHRIRLYLPLFISLIVIPNLSAQSENFTEKILIGFDLALQEKYTAAESLYQSIIDENPNSIEARFYKAAVIQMKMTDYETDIFTNEFDGNMNWVIKHLEDKKKNEKLSAWELYYLGAAYSYFAGFDARLGKWIAGFSNIMRGVDYLEQALNKDSEIFDAYLYLGNYEYYKSRKIVALRFIPGIEDTADEGVEMVKLAVKKAKYCNILSRISLMWIYIQEEEFEKALDLVTGLLHQYPSNRAFNWALGEIYYQTENWIAAEEVYESLLERIETANPINNFNMVSCLSRLAIVYYKLKDYESCLSACQRGLSLELSDAHRERLKEELEGLINSREKCLKVKTEN